MHSSHFVHHDETAVTLSTRTCFFTGIRSFQSRRFQLKKRTFACNRSSTPCSHNAVSMCPNDGSIFDTTDGGDPLPGTSFFTFLNDLGTYTLCCLPECVSCADNGEQCVAGVDGCCARKIIAAGLDCPPTGGVAPCIEFKEPDTVPVLP